MKGFLPFEDEVFINCDMLFKWLPKKEARLQESFF